MDRTLVLAAGFSAALHAGLLLGPHEKVPLVRAAPPALLLKPIYLPAPEPEPEDAVPSEEKAPAPTASPLPRSAEPPATPKPTDFEMRTVPAVPVDAHLRDFRDVDFSTTTDAIRRGAIISSINLDNLPRVRTQVAPNYPSEQRRLGQAGSVLVEFLVDEEGRVTEPRVMKSTDRAFEEATLRAILRWRFEPGRKDGRVVRFRMAVPVEFNLNHD